MMKTYKGDETLLVSIITPVLNGEPYLEKCIQSVLEQDYSNVEHVLVDGGSIDGTLDILDRYAAEYPDRVRVFRGNDKCAEEAINKGWKNAKGDIFGWIGSDDTLEQYAASFVADYFRSNPEADFVFGGCVYIDCDDRIIGKVEEKDFDLDDAINDWSYIPTTSAFYRREVVENTGLLNEATRASDLDYWLRVAQVYPIYREDKVLSRFRRHKKSKSRSYLGTILYAWDCIKISLRYGGTVFSIYRRYLRCFIVEPLEPVLGFTYPFIKKLFKI